MQNKYLPVNNYFVNQIKNFTFIGLWFMFKIQLLPSKCVILSCYSKMSITDQRDLYAI